MFVLTRSRGGEAMSEISKYYMYHAECASTINLCCDLYTSSTRNYIKLKYFSLVSTKLLRIRKSLVVLVARIFWRRTTDQSNKSVDCQIGVLGSSQLDNTADPYIGLGVLLSSIFFVYPWLSLSMNLDTSFACDIDTEITI